MNKLHAMKKIITLIVIAALVAVNHLAVAQEKTKTVFSFEPLPYAYDALDKAIDAQTMEIHYSRHHKAYFDNFIKAIAGTDIEFMTLEEIFGSMSKFPASVRNNGGGFYNHSLFWAVMSPDGGQPSAALEKAIVSTFGSMEEFRKQFEKAGATRFGSGWAWLSVDAQGKLFISSTANQDNPLMDVVAERGTPVLGLDVWEHAYYLRYQNKRASYMEAFWQVVNWNEVSRRYQAAMGAK